MFEQLDISKIFRKKRSMQLLNTQHYCDDLYFNKMLSIDYHTHILRKLVLAYLFNNEYVQARLNVHECRCEYG